MMESMHGLHVFRNVQPTMSRIVEGLDQQDVCNQGTFSTDGNHRQIREEHSREKHLQRNLCVHVQNCSNKIIIALPLKLFLWKFVQVVVLVKEEVMQSQRQSGGDDTCNSDGVDWKNRCVENV